MLRKETIAGRDYRARELTALEYAGLMDRIDVMNREGASHVDRMKLYIDVCVEYVVEPALSPDEWNRAPIDVISSVAGFVMTPKKTGDEPTDTVSDS